MYIAEMRDGATLGKARQSEYMTVSGACFINQSSPVMTISKNGIRFSKACHSRLDDCEYTERVRIEESGTKTDVTRLISARMATEFERGLYYGKNE